MELTSQTAVLAALIFVVAFLYSSVGHGGASGYLAVMSFYALQPGRMSSAALILNVLVSGIAFTSYRKAGHFKKSLLWPFVIASVPMSFVGGALPISVTSYSYVLAAVLLFSAFRLNMNITEESPKEGTPNLGVFILVGGTMGLVSGIVGIGGGIFLSCYLLLAGWATTKESSAVAAPFILVNSIAGLSARIWQGKAVFAVSLPFIAAAFLGGILGSYLGANRFTSVFLRRILGLVLLSACLKLLF